MPSLSLRHRISVRLGIADIFHLRFPNQKHTSSIPKTYVLRLENVRPPIGGHKTETAETNFLYNTHVNHTKKEH